MKVCSQEVHGCIFVTVVCQMVAWTIVSVLLIYRGLTNFSNMETTNGTFSLATNLTDTSSEEDVTMKGHTAGIIMIVVASIMLIIGPTFFIIALIEKCYRKHRFRKIPQEDLPPKYEDVVVEEMAPRYSTLFLNEENLGDSFSNERNQNS